MRIGRGLMALATVLAMASLARAGEEGETFRIEGSSTVRDWTCQVPDHEEQVVLDGPAEAVLGGTATLRELVIIVPVAAIECGNDTMHDHLRKALRAEDHPEVTFSLSSYDLATAADGTTASVEGTLRIAGEDEPVTLDVSVASADGALRVVGEHDIDMTAWGVKPPSLMFGVMKVGEQVTVAFDVTLRP